jgi:hypothetical protein
MSAFQRPSAASQLSCCVGIGSGVAVLDDPPPHAASPTDKATAAATAVRLFNHLQFIFNPPWPKSRPAGQDMKHHDKATLHLL